MSSSSRALSSRRRAAWLVLSAVLPACGHQDGVVGVQPLAAAGQPALGAAGAAFLEEFAADNHAWAAQTVLPGAATSLGAQSPTARDGYVAELRFPGHPDYAPGDNVGAQFVTELATQQRFHFGTYRTRLSFGACAPGEEAVMAFLGYFNDHQDHDGDGITDDLEIDVQVTCGTPHRMFLTVFTDDEEPPQGTRFRKLSRVVDFETGEVFQTPAADSASFAAVGNDPTFVAPELLAPDAFYELGFEWHTDSLRFFLKLHGAERDLWTLTGAELVPQLPVEILFNIWHPETHWYPAEGAADFPASDVVMRVDWVSFQPE